MFRVTELKNPQRKYKVDINAQQLFLTGVCFSDRALTHEVALTNNSQGAFLIRLMIEVTSVTLKLQLIGVLWSSCVFHKSFCSKFIRCDLWISFAARFIRFISFATQAVRFFIRMSIL